MAAEPVIAAVGSPRVDVSAMDGYAVIDAATRPGDELRIVGESFAGAGFGRGLGAGETVRVQVHLRRVTSAAPRVYAIHVTET